MTELYLNNEYIETDNSQQIKMTVENPLLSQTGSYSLDVVIPMGIERNALFFRNVHRADTTKDFKEMTAALFVENRKILEGTATVTKVTEKAVTVQLLGGRAGVLFRMKNEKVYIDEMDLGRINVAQLLGLDEYPKGHSSTGVRRGGGGVVVPNYETRWGEVPGKTDGISLGNAEECVFFPVWDETNDQWQNKAKAIIYLGEYTDIVQECKAIQPNFLMVVRKIIRKTGYEIGRCDIDRVPFNRMCIANARTTTRIGAILPHWTVVEFIEEVEKLFNCTFVFDDVRRTVSIIGNATLLDEKTATIEVADEYEGDVSKEGDSQTETLLSENVEYDLSDSEEHYYDSLEDEIFKDYTVLKFNSEAEIHDFCNSIPTPERDSMRPDAKMKYIFICPTGTFVWASNEDYEDDEEKVVWGLRQVNQFGKLIRNESKEDSTSLRICPVATTGTHEAELWVNYSGAIQPVKKPLPVLAISMKNPLGDSNDDTLENVWYRIIDFEEKENKETQNEDRIQLFFVGTKSQNVEVGQKAVDVLKGVDARYLPNDYKEWLGEHALLPYPMAWTDSKDKLAWLTDVQNTRDAWSMSLSSRTAATQSIAKLQKPLQQVNSHAEIKHTFLSDSVPDIYSTFLINNKRYCCSKIEYNIKDGKIDRLMNGYFHERTNKELEETEYKKVETNTESEYNQGGSDNGNSGFGERGGQR